MSVIIPLLALYAFMTSRGSTLHFFRTLKELLATSVKFAEACKTFGYIISAK